jgi:hypothetical protein
MPGDAAHMAQQNEERSTGPQGVRLGVEWSTLAPATDMCVSGSSAGDASFLLASGGACSRPDAREPVRTIPAATMAPKLIIHEKSPSPASPAIAVPNLAGGSGSVPASP